MAKRKSCGPGSGLFNAGTVVWVPYKGVQWPAVISRYYASQKKVTYKFLPVNDSDGVFNAPCSKIKPFLLKDPPPGDSDDKLQAAYEAALEEVKKQRLEKGESLEDPEEDTNSEELSSDTSRKRTVKVEEKAEVRKTGQKEFEIGDIVLFSCQGYADWPAVVVALRKRDVACHLFPLKTCEPQWYAKSACQEFNVDQKTFTAMRKREPTIERQRALDEAWELMTQTTKQERRERCKQKCEAMERKNKEADIGTPNSSHDASKDEEIDIAVTSTSAKDDDNEVDEAIEVPSSVPEPDNLEDERMEELISSSVPASEKTTDSVIEEETFEPAAKRKKVSKKEGSTSRMDVKSDFGNIAVQEPGSVISDFDEAMEEFLKDYLVEKGQKKAAEDEMSSSDSAVEHKPITDQLPQSSEKEEETKVPLDVAREETVTEEVESAVLQEEEMVAGEKNVPMDIGEEETATVENGIAALQAEEEAVVSQEEAVVEPPIVDEEVVIETATGEEELVFETSDAQQEVVVEPFASQEPLVEPPVSQEEILVEPPVAQEEVAVESAAANEKLVVETPDAQEEMVPEPAAAEGKLVFVARDAQETMVPEPVAAEEKIVVEPPVETLVAELVGRVEKEVAVENLAKSDLADNSLDVSIEPNGSV